MASRARRNLITLIVVLAAIGVVVVVVLNPGAPKPASNAADDSNQPMNSSPDQEAAETTPADDPGETAQATDEDDAGNETDTAQDELPVTDPQPGVALTGLRAIAPNGAPDAAAPPATIGSLDWRDAKFLIEFSPNGAGIDRITFSDIWITAEAKRLADKVKERIEKGEATLADLPEEERFILQETREFILNDGTPVKLPSFVAREISIPGINDPDDAADDRVDLFPRIWSSTVSPDRRSAEFSTEIRNDAGQPVVRITRTYTIQQDAFDITVEQRIENLTTHDLTFRWLQYGPADLDVDPARYMDRRRYRIGHLIDPVGQPANVQADKALFRERQSVAKIGDKNANPATVQPATLWPTSRSAKRGYEISWFAAENRYFAMAMHPISPTETGNYTIAHVIDTLTPYRDGKSPNDARNPGNDIIAFEVLSPVHQLPGGETTALDFGVFAGPMDRELLSEKQPYQALNMSELILYQLTAFCGICTWQWLAHFLLWFLSLVHSILFDWGIAIILLVVVVRTILHPITKKSQIAMQRFGKVMQKIKPEIEKLQKKYKDDPRRMQQEQLRMMREYGVSPFSMLGCLPMFLQMPIWIALYAMLYFAWDIRHEPAFWGVFQMIGNWSFLGDLSAPDRLITFPWEGRLWTFDYGSLNILPLLMGAIFFFQQKYMTPPNPNMSEDQERMQKMMRIMFLLFPIFLYSAPSGLTLYIITSSIIGITESRYIRRHIDAIDLDAELRERKAAALQTKKKKPRNPQQRAMQQMMEDRKQRARDKRKPPPKRYKKRK